MEMELQEAKKEARQRNLENEEIGAKIKELEKDRSQLKASLDKAEGEKTKALENLKKA